MRTARCVELVQHGPILTLKIAISGSRRDSGIRQPAFERFGHVVKSLIGRQPFLRRGPRPDHGVDGTALDREGQCRDQNFGVLVTPIEFI